MRNGSVADSASDWNVSGGEGTVSDAVGDVAGVCVKELFECMCNTACNCAMFCEYLRPLLVMLLLLLLLMTQN